ncbi:MAG: hypothetical protein Q8M20_05105 [Rhodocyclaceae bacterium]|nr:hypothetical protein [Rhodocyclaceae bacterium]MDZ4214139.1 hypothetical protein [Rhodocyclaceae bacterium]
MNQPPSDSFDYFPVILCIVCDSPIDALVALCVRRGEAMDLVAAAWLRGETGCIVATLHGGRQIAVIPTPDGRWAACNAFLDEVFATPQEATWKLNTLLKRGRKGYVGYVHRYQVPISRDGQRNGHAHR